MIATVVDDVVATGRSSAATSRARRLLDETTGFRLGRLARVLKARFASSLRPLGLTPPQAAVLRALGERSPEGVRAVARRLSADPMNVKHCADELEERGLLRSTHVSADRRLRGLEPTALGMAALESLAGVVQSEEEWLEAVLGSEGLAALARALDRLEAALGIGSAVRSAGPRGSRRAASASRRGEEERA